MEQTIERTQQWSAPSTTSMALETTEHRPVGLVDLGQFRTAAEVFIKSGYFDSALGKTSPEVMVARAQVKLAAGAEIGLPPFLALQGIHWIQPENQPGRLMKGAAVCAYVLGRSKKYRYTTIERSDKQAVIEFEELRDGKWVKVYTSTYTQQMAGAMVNKAVYKNYMPAMLWNRAMTNGANVVGADEINGPAGEPDDVPEAESHEVSGNGHNLIPEDVEATPNVAAETTPEIAAAPVEPERQPIAATSEKPKRKAKAVQPEPEADTDLVDDALENESEGFRPEPANRERGSISAATKAKVNAFYKADETGLKVLNLVKAKGWSLGGTQDLSEYQGQIIVAVCEGRDEADVR
jgi:hypothetical protein